MSRVLYGVAGTFFLAFAVFEMIKYGTSIALVGLLALIAPDVTLFIGTPPGERGQLSPRAVPWYNAAHRLAGPIVLLFLCALVPLWGPAGFTAGLAWFAHICLDRAFGYGLRTADGRQRSALTTGRPRPPRSRVRP